MLLNISFLCQPIFIDKLTFNLRLNLVRDIMCVNVLVYVIVLILMYSDKRRNVLNGA